MDTLFNQLPLFANLTAQQRAILLPLFTCTRCLADQTIFEQGSRAEYLFILVEGDVAVQFKPDDAPAINVSQIRPGQVFGWSAAFGSGVYTSGAVCTIPSTLLRVRGADLRTLRQKYPETGILILKRLAELVAERLEGSHRHSQVVAMLDHALENGVKPIGG